MKRRGRCSLPTNPRKAPFDEVRTACPYNIPRQDQKTKVLVKCTMCFDRITNNRVPACVLSLPDGGDDFRGPKDAILEWRPRSGSRS